MPREARTVHNLFFILSWTLQLTVAARSAFSLSFSSADGGAAEAARQRRVLTPHEPRSLLYGTTHR